MGDGTPSLEAGAFAKGARPPGAGLQRPRQPRGCRGEGRTEEPRCALTLLTLTPRSGPALQACALSPQRTGSGPGASPASSVSAGPAETGGIRQPRGLRALPPALGRVSRGRRRERSRGSLAALPPPLPPVPPSPSAGPSRCGRCSGAAPAPRRRRPGRAAAGSRRRPGQRVKVAPPASSVLDTQPSWIRGTRKFMR